MAIADIRCALSSSCWPSPAASSEPSAFSSSAAQTFASKSFESGILPHHPAPRRRICSSSNSRSSNFTTVVAAGIHIDRRRYFDDLLTRQLVAEAREVEATWTCPLDCVREVYNCHQFEKILFEAEEANKLVVVDFYSSSCGACKYLLPQLVKLCKNGCGDVCSVDDPAGVIYVKHNVRDEYDELTDLARFYTIRTVPMFALFLNGSPIEKFYTSDRHRLHQALCQIFERFVK